VKLSEFPGLNHGTTEYHVWYMSPGFFRDGIMGYAFLEEQNALPDIDRPERTHIKANDINDAFAKMQGENWSPHGEANGFVQEKGRYR